MGSSERGGNENPVEGGTGGVASRIQTNTRSESKWNLIRQKLVRRLLEEQDKVLRSCFAQKGGTRGQRGEGTHGQGREHVKWDMYGSSKSGKCAEPRYMTKGSVRDEWGRFSSVVGFIYLFKLSLIKLSL